MYQLNAPSDGTSVFRLKYATDQAGRQLRISVNGQSYASIDDMPPDVRKQYDDASAALLQTNKTDVSVNLESRAIGNLPLSGYRNFQTLVNLVPGATPGRYQNAVIDTPQRDLTFNFNGFTAGLNTLTFDVKQVNLANEGLDFSGSIDTPSAVPEPFPLALLGTGLIGLVGLSRRYITTE